jgi:hypothetical protein
MPGIRDTAYPQLKKYSLRQGVGGGLHSKSRGTGLGGEANEGEDAACWSSRLAQDVFIPTTTSSTKRGHFFYEKVRKVKADVAALLIFDLRHISTKKFALGSLRSDDWQLGRPTVPPVLSVLP